MSQAEKIPLITKRVPYLMTAEIDLITRIWCGGLRSATCHMAGQSLPRPRSGTYMKGGTCGATCWRRNSIALRQTVDGYIVLGSVFVQEAVDEGLIEKLRYGDEELRMYRMTRRPDSLQLQPIFLQRPISQQINPPINNPPITSPRPSVLTRTVLCHPYPLPRSAPFAPLFRHPTLPPSPFSSSASPSPLPTPTHTSPAPSPHPYYQSHSAHLPATDNTHAPPRDPPTPCVQQQQTASSSQPGA